MKLVIGLVGEKGGGKETVTRFLGECAGVPIAHLRFSDILGETLAIWGLPFTRENTQKLPVAMNQFYGEGTLTRAMEARIRKRPEELVVLDGVRWLTDEQLLRSFPHALIVYVTAPIQTRFERTRARKEKAGESNTTWELFVEQEHAHNEIFISDIGSRADVKLVNNGTFEELKENVRTIFEEKIRPALVRP
jgi:dephospho-CoA kinase